jgi:uncharacterized membrane protein
MVALAMRARGAVRSEGLERRVVGRVVLAAVPLLMLIDVIATYFLDSGPAPLLWVLAGLMATEPKTRLARSPVADGSERPRPALAGV